MRFADVVRENIPFIMIGVAGGAAWAVIVFTATRTSRPPRKKSG